jgi:hypothetical protein
VAAAVRPDLTKDRNSWLGTWNSWCSSRREPACDILHLDPSILYPAAPDQSAGGQVEAPASAACNCDVETKLHHRLAILRCNAEYLLCLFGWSNLQSSPSIWALTYIL